MPPKNRKKRFSVKFELSPKGLIGTTIVCLCIFLWMFLFGVWAGQTLLDTSPVSGSIAKKKKVKKVRPQAYVPPRPEKPAVTIDREITKTAEAPGTTIETRSEPEEDPSFFSVQVAAFKDKKLAVEAVKKWKSKGYKAFSRPPGGGDDPFTRVYIGKFDLMDKAKEHAELLKKKENQKPFIALIPGAR